jgi:hypothetical protein
MKTQIENPVLLEETDALNVQKFAIFNEIVSDAIMAKDENHLRRLLAQSSLYEKWFKYGFGSTHFWLTDKSDRSSKRILFIEFK